MFKFETTKLFDSHCHLNEAVFDTDRPDVISRAKMAGVSSVIDIAVDIPSAEIAIVNARNFPGEVFASVGIVMECLIPGSHLYDPDFEPADFPDLMVELRKLIAQNREYVAMIGETGIDDYWLQKLLKGKEIGPKRAERVLFAQEKLFRSHLELALEFELPLSVHSRAVEQQCLEIVKSYPGARGIFHSYTGDYSTAKQILDAGWGLGVNGIVTYKNAGELRGMYAQLLGNTSGWSPKDFYDHNIFFETDGPFLAPLSRRGERNEPENLREIYSSMTSLPFK